MNTITKISAKLKSVLSYPSSFRHFGKKSLILCPLQIDGKKNISVGDHVVVGEHSWLAAMPLTNNDKPQLIISNNCSIGNFNHIYATSEIVFEDSVLTADKVYISDNLHTYEDVSKPIIEQPIKQLKKIRIGEGSWIGENVCIIGASIGKHCTIGANSVVTHDIPDYCVAVGAPARVIKRYNKKTQMWEKVEGK
ncbi:MAG: acyltransferase [Paludibacteraceae bacterium]|nr:acyltransferase [Paludibacteraceae bacterium]